MLAGLAVECSSYFIGDPLMGKTFFVWTFTNPLHTDRLFNRYMLDEFICHFRGVGSILSLLFYF